jgi:hypothetical protein
MAELFVEAQKRGLPVEPLGRRTGYINGKLCVPRQACWHRIGKTKYKYRYISIRRHTGRFEVCGWKLPDGRFLILPRDLANFPQTSFGLKEGVLPGPDSTSHYYRECIEKWSVLGPTLRAI